MYQYLYVDKNVVKKFPSDVYNFLWIPMVLAHFPNCKPKDLYLIDCLFSDVCENPYTVVILLEKVSKKAKLVDEMPVEAKKILVRECSSLKAFQNLQKIAHDVASENYFMLQQLIDSLSEFSDVEIPYRVFLRTRKYVIPAEKVRQSTIRITCKMTRKLMENLCFIRKNVVTTPEIDAKPVYVLAYYSSNYVDGGFIVDKKILRRKALTRILKNFQSKLANIIT